VPGSIHGQVGQGSEQPNLVEDVPSHCRRGGQDDLLGWVPTQNILWFYDTL